VVIANRCIQHMQKALIAMNVQLHNAISDLSGQAIICAILSGQRDPRKLAALRHWRIQASEEEILHSLQGNWKQDVLFELQQAVDAYDFYRKQIAQCDSQLKQYMVALPTRKALPTTPRASEPVAATDTRKKRRPRKPKGNQPGFAPAEELERILGVNATLIDGIDAMTIQTVLAGGKVSS
jgi:transposase